MTDELITVEAPSPHEQGTETEGALSAVPLDQELAQAPQPMSLPGMEGSLQPVEVDQLRSMRQRAGFDPFAAFPEEWAERFIELEHRYRWELAVYIVWASLPKDQRQPPTLQELCKDVFLIGARCFRMLRARHPEIEESIHEMRAKAVYNYIPDVFAALGTLASKPDFHNIPAMKLILEMGKHYTPRQDVGIMPGWVQDAAAKPVDLDNDKLTALADMPGDGEDE